jgi:hypothetical protein
VIPRSPPWPTPLAAIAPLCATTFACNPAPINAVELDLSSQLIAYYPFDDGTGSIVHDHSGHNLDGTLVGGTWNWIPDGKFGGALHLDAYSYVTVGSVPNASSPDATSPNASAPDASLSEASSPDAGLLDTGLSEASSPDAGGLLETSLPDASFPDQIWSSFTVSTWVRTSGWYDAAQFETVASTEEVFDGGWEINIENDPGGAVELQAAFYDHLQPPVMNHGYREYDCLCLPPDVWTHFAFVVDGVAHTMTTYVNGQLAPNTAMFSNPVTAPDPIFPGVRVLSIGTWSGPGPRFLIGDIDDLAIYGRALQPAEILALQQNPPIPP